MAGGYEGTRQKSQAHDDFYEKTAARIKKIQDHFVEAPRTGAVKGKVCIVTGVGSLKGIGRASSILLAREGAKHLYLLDLDPTNLPNLKSTIQEAYPEVKVDTIQADAADEQAIVGVCERAIKEEGKLDVFFANAGWASTDALDDTSLETFDKSMRINASSCFLAIKYASAAMLQGNPSEGSIILTASTAGLRSGAGTLDYSASKAAVNSMAKTAAYQLQKTNIRVNSICPGLIETGMTDFTFQYARKRGSEGKIGQLNPLGRYGVAEEIAQVALFLASDSSSYVNGQNLAVDGGLSASHPVVPGRWA